MDSDAQDGNTAVALEDGLFGFIVYFTIIFSVVYKAERLKNYSSLTIGLRVYFFYGFLQNRECDLMGYFFNY